MLPRYQLLTRPIGAREENRTPDLLITSELLCRLSYPGMGEQPYPTMRQRENPKGQPRLADRLADRPPSPVRPAKAT